MKYNTDKFTHGLIPHYERIFAPIKDKKIKLLEIGVLGGGSLKYWSDYFTDSVVVGIDINLPSIVFPSNVIVRKCNQNDSVAIEALAEEFGGFDVIIDDGAHFKKETENCFNILWKHVAPGGYYVIEDWAVGYWRNQSRYVGMTETITSIVERTPELGIISSNVIFNNHSIALFQKG
jgi:demethylmacrocin O-methyltransferase